MTLLVIIEIERKMRTLETWACSLQVVVVQCTEFAALSGLSWRTDFINLCPTRLKMLFRAGI
jgi:hypothetical protein